MKLVFAVRLGNKAEKQLRKLEPSILSRVLELFKVLEYSPVPAKEFSLIKLSGREDTYRVRLSSYRVAYTVFWDEKVVRILKVEKRSETTYN